MKTLLLMALLLMIPSFAIAQERSESLNLAHQTAVYLWFNDNLDSIKVIRWLVYDLDTNGEEPMKLIVEYSDKTIPMNKIAFLFNGDKMIAAIDLRTATFDERCKFAFIASSKTM